MIKLETVLIPIADILVVDRQRSELNMQSVEALAESIRRRGLIHTVLVEEGTLRLIAGENRLAAYRMLHERHGEEYAKIPARLAQDPTRDEMIALELEENIRRSELGWQDTARAIAAYHDTLGNIHGAAWRLEDTGAAINMQPPTISRYITVARELAKGNELVTKATGLAAAYNALNRARDRQMNRELNNLIIGDAGVSAPAPSRREERALERENEDDWNTATTPNEEYPLIHGDFIKWAADYSGRRFNFVHCDFPYGISWDKSKKGGTSSFTRSAAQAYDDSIETYAALIHALFENRARLLEPECHIMFWLSARYDYHELTRELILSLAPDARIDSCPLIWHRADSSGVLPDPARGGRRTYETALQITLGDRKIVRAVDMSVALASHRADRHHISQKPDEVLRHFFRMYVDDSTDVLDPTCGFGGALRAAEFLGARSVLGIEQNLEIATNAYRECLAFRVFNKRLEDV